RPFRQSRHVEGGRLQPPVVGLANLADGLRGTRSEAVLAGPDGLACTGIESSKPRVVLAIAHAAAGSWCCQALTYQGQDRVHLLGRLGFGDGRCTGCGGRWPIDLGRRERVGRRPSRGPGVEVERAGRFTRGGLAPRRSGKAAQRAYRERDRKKRPIDHHRSPRTRPLRAKQTTCSDRSLPTPYPASPPT